MLHCFFASLDFQRRGRWTETLAVAGRSRIFQHSRTIQLCLRCWGCCSCTSQSQKQKVFFLEGRMLFGAGISCHLCSQETMLAFDNTGHSFCLHCCNLLQPCAAGIRGQSEKWPYTKVPSMKNLFRVAKYSLKQGVSEDLMWYNRVDCWLSFLCIFRNAVLGKFSGSWCLSKLSTKHRSTIELAWNA